MENYLHCGNGATSHGNGATIYGNGGTTWRNGAIICRKGATTEEIVQRWKWWNWNFQQTECSYQRKVQLPEEMLQFLINRATTQGYGQLLEGFCNCLRKWCNSGNGATQKMVQLTATKSATTWENGVTTCGNGTTTWGNGSNTSGNDATAWWKVQLALKIAQITEKRCKSWLTLVSMRSYLSMFMSSLFRSATRWVLHSPLTFL